jgi:HSP20 family protein
MAHLNRWSPFDEALSLRDAMSRLIEESVVRPTTGGQGFTPALDLYETNEGFHIDLAVPGLRPEELDITLQENVLTVSGEYKQQKQEGRNYHHSERRYGRFSRAITFPTQVKGDGITAECENGILTITVPKAEEVKPRKINVQVGQQKSIEAGRK